MPRLSRKPKQSEADKMEARREAEQLALRQHSDQAKVALAEARAETPVAEDEPIPEPGPKIEAPPPDPTGIYRWPLLIFADPTDEDAEPAWEFYNRPSPLAVRKRAMRAMDQLEFNDRKLRAEREHALNLRGYERIDRKLDESEREWAQLMAVAQPIDPITGRSLLQPCRMRGCMNDLFKTQTHALMGRCEDCHRAAYGHTYDPEGRPSQ